MANVDNVSVLEKSNQLTQAQKPDWNAIRAADARRANLYTIGFNAETGTFDVAGGIVLRQNGERHNVYLVPVGSKNIYTTAYRHYVGGHAVMLSAEVVTKEKNGKTVYSLCRPSEQLGYRIVKIDAVIPGTFEKETLSGILTDGLVVAEFRGTYEEHRRDEKLVKLDKGKSVTVLLANGNAKKYIFDGIDVVEVPLSATDVGNERIAFAKCRLAEVLTIEDGEKRSRTTAGILHALINMLIVSWDENGARALAAYVMSLSREHIDMVHKRVFGIFAEHDKSLLPLLRNGASSKKRNNKPYHTRCSNTVPSYGAGETAMGAALRRATVAQAQQ